MFWTEGSGGKSNEITAIAKLLDQIQIKGELVTSDVLETQKETAEKIRKERADNALAVKGKRGHGRKI